MNPAASCVGLAISEHAVNDGAGAIVGIVGEVKDVADLFGFDNSGQVIGRLARVHAGSHVPACEEAFEDILVAGP